MIWSSCVIAEIKKCAIHIVERGIQPITKLNDPYYKTLKREFNFKKIKYSNIKASTLSTGGRVLVTNGHINRKREIPIVLLSVLMEY